MSDIVIRPAENKDLPAVQALVNASWRATYAGAIPDDRMAGILERRHALDLFGRQLASEGGIFLIAEDNGIIVGHAYAQQQSDDLYLDRLHIAPHRKGQGIGSMLMDEIFSAARDGRPVTVEIVEDNHAARGFYERFGFRVTEKTPNCGGEMGVAALVMQRPAG